MKPAHLSHRWILKKRTDFGIFPLDTKAFRVPRVSLTLNRLWLPASSNQHESFKVLLWLQIPAGIHQHSDTGLICHHKHTRVCTVVSLQGNLSLTASHCFCNRWRVQVTFRRRLQVWMSRQSFTQLSSLTDSGIIFYPHMQTWFTSDLHVSSSYIRSLAARLEQLRRLMSVLGWVWGSTRIQNQERLFRKNSHSTSKLFLCFCRVYIRG